MREEEIIKYIKDEIEDDKDTMCFFEDKENPTRKSIEECINAHQGLLDLYEQEKEKNTELRIQISARETVVDELEEKNKELSDKLIEKICNGVEEDILEEYRQQIRELKEKNKKLVEGQIKTIETILLPELLKHYVNKDKLKEKIDDLMCKERTSELEMGNLYRYGIVVLNSILEEK